MSFHSVSCDSYLVPEVLFHPCSPLRMVLLFNGGAAILCCSSRVSATPVRRRLPYGSDPEHLRGSNSLIKSTVCCHIVIGHASVIVPWLPEDHDRRPSLVLLLHVILPTVVQGLRFARSLSCQIDARPSLLSTTKLSHDSVLDGNFQFVCLIFRDPDCLFAIDVRRRNSLFGLSPDFRPCTRDK